MPNRRIDAIAQEISENWPKSNYAAKPYLDAMKTLATVEQFYYQDSGREIVGRFLCNAGTWRGEVAKRVKAELKQLIK